MKRKRKANDKRKGKKPDKIAKQPVTENPQQPKPEQTPIAEKTTQSSPSRQGFWATVGAFWKGLRGIGQILVTVITIIGGLAEV